MMAGNRDAKASFVSSRSVQYLARSLRSPVSRGTAMMLLNLSVDGAMLPHERDAGVVPSADVCTIAPRGPFAFAGAAVTVQGMRLTGSCAALAASPPQIAVPDAFTLLVSHLRLCSQETQCEVLCNIIALLTGMARTVNRAVASATVPSLLDAMLDLLPFAAPDVATLACAVIAEVGCHHVTVRQLKRVFRMLQGRSADVPACAWELLDALRATIEVSHGPTRYFAFAGSRAGLRFVTQVAGGRVFDCLPSWPARAYSFAVWFMAEEPSGVLFPRRGRDFGAMQRKEGRKEALGCGQTDMAATTSVPSHLLAETHVPHIISVADACGRRIDLYMRHGVLHLRLRHRDTAAQEIITDADIVPNEWTHVGQCCVPYCV